MKSNNIVTYDNLHNLSQEVTDLLLRKNADYGAAYRKYGVAGILVRLSDKSLRLQNLNNGQQALVVDEKIEDTLLDMCGYAMLGLLELRQQRELAYESPEPYSPI